MTKIATYNQARSLAHALGKFGIRVKPETFDMRTSGIYIPRWIGYSRIPHHFDPLTQIAYWYFFLRFEDSTHADINVGEALDFTSAFRSSRGIHPMKALAEKIKTGGLTIKH